MQFDRYQKPISMIILYIFLGFIAFVILAVLALYQIDVIRLDRELKEFEKAKKWQIKTIYPPVRATGPAGV